MIAHVATFIWNEDVTPADIDRLDEALSGLPGVIPAIRSYSYGRDLGIRDGNADYAVVALVDDAGAVSGYLDHPYHKQMSKELISPMVKERRAVQLDWSPTP